ncbi:RNA polymerase sigma factor, sigma-70 family [Longilinea arvoryzae]|uniref:RNA polymerase sigma factor, sigma-70 family n=1 Tax=Longilinea arvoryzae TaxID=360412 RepID=A0A0S7BNH4_9CHLR|nr:sigma-70 family RNA polymerase sigma factor [Longilinea arvoryzae]GAP15563.1 RNA polymerase sigma factor, sigma-70 family [Longilinea arvoryzae]
MSLSLAAEQELIHRAQWGDDLAFEELIEANSPRLFRTIRRLCQDDGEAEAVLQETFWRVWRNLAHYHDDRPLFPYLVTIAVNQLRDSWRTQRWLDDTGLDESADQIAQDAPSPEGQLLALQDREQLARALQQLTPAYRAVIVLRYQADMSYEEIASALKLPVNTVRVHLHRAKTLLRQSMENENG